MDVTVKTLDSTDHKFTAVDASWTVAQFKDFIKDTVNVAPDRQRLIFRGKVLQDDKKLQEIGAHGNVLHLVERPPPTETGGAPRERQRPPPRPGMTTRPTGQNVFMGSFPLPVSNMSSQEIEATVRRVLDSLGEIGRNATMAFHEAPGGNSVDLRITLRAPDRRPQDSPARARIQLIRNVIRQANHILYHLETDDNQAEAEESQSGERQEEEGGESDPVDSLRGVVPPGCVEEAHEEVPAPQPSSAAGVAAETSEASTPPASNERPATERVRHAEVGDLASAMDEMLRIQDRMRPHVDRYQHMLRNERDFSDDNTEEGRRTSRFFNGMQILLHNISHIYHTMSDLNIHFCEPTPRSLYPQILGEEHSEPPEAQITLNFQSTNNGERGRGAGASGGETSGGGNNGNQGAQAQGPGQRRSFTIPFTQNHGDSSQAQGVMQMEVTPTGIAIRATTVTSAPTPTNSSNTATTSPPPPTTPSTTQATGGAIGSAPAPQSAPIRAPNNTAQGGGNPQNMMNNFFQQMMQGLQAGRGVMPPNMRPPPGVGIFGPNPARAPFPGMLPAGHFGGFPPGVGRPGGPRLVGMGMGRMPLRPPPQGQPFPPPPPPGMRFPLPQAGMSPGINMNNMMNMMRPRGPRPGPGLGQNHLGGPAIFVGPRPPADLPLYTVDPFLPCASRHFDPRNASRRHRGRQAQSTQTQTLTPPGQQAQANNAPGPSNESGGSETENEAFESALTQMLRSVVINLTNEAGGNAQGLNPNEMYNFHPLAGGGGMVAAVPIQVDASITVHGSAPPPNEAQPAPASAEGAQPDPEEGEGAGEEVVREELGNVMAEIFQQMAGGQDMTLAEFLRNIGEEMISGEGVIGEVFRILAEVLSFRNIMAVFSGNSDCLNEERARIRRFLIDDVLNGNDRPSDEDFSSAARRLSAPEVFNELAQGVRPRTEDLCIAQSLVRCGEAAVEDALKIIFREDSQDFGRRLYDRVKLFMRELLFLGAYVCEDGQRGAQVMIDRYLETMTAHVGPNMAEWVHRMSREHLHNTLTQSGLTQADIQRFLIYRHPHTPHTAQTTSVEEKKDAAKDVKEEKKTEAPKETAPVPLTESQGEEATESSVKEPETHTSPVLENGDARENWKRSLPSDWVKVIEADVETQKLQLKQPQLSDAYLAGMPPKRRKMMYEKKLKSLTGSGGESSFRSLLREAVSETGAQPITGEQVEDVIQDSPLPRSLSSAFTEKVKDGMRDRLKRDSDYQKNPSRFPNAEKLFKP